MANYYSYNTNQVQADINMDNAIKDIQNQLLNIPTDTQLSLKANQTDLNTTNANVTANTSQLADIMSQVINVKHPPSPLVGVKGDGTDETNLIQTISDYCATNNKVLLFPYGTYGITTILPKQGIVGYLSFGATLKSLSNVGEGMIATNLSTQVNKFFIKGFVFDCNRVHRRAIFVYGSKVTVSNNEIINLDNPANTSIQAIRFYWDSSDNFIENNKITLGVDSPFGTYPSGIGINITGKSVSSYAGLDTSDDVIPATNISYRNTVRNNYIYGGTHGISLMAAEHTKVYGNTLEMQTHRNIILSPQANHNTINNNDCINFGSAGVHLAYGSSNNKISDNKIWSDGSLMISGGSGGEGAIQAYIHCMNNQIIDNKIYSRSTRAGIRVAVHSNGTTIQGNEVDGGLKVGISVESDFLPTYDPLEIYAPGNYTPPYNPSWTSWDNGKKLESITIKNNTIYRNDNSLTNAGIHVSQSANAQINYLTVEGNTVHSIDSLGHDVYVFVKDNTLFNYNVFRNNFVTPLEVLQVTFTNSNTVLQSYENNSWLDRNITISTPTNILDITKTNNITLNAVMTIDTVNGFMIDPNIVSRTIRVKLYPGAAITHNSSKIRLRGDVSVTATTTSQVITFILIAGILYEVSRNFETRKKGSITYSGDGTTTTKTIPHGLSVAPSTWFVQEASVDAGTAEIKQVTADATNLTVTYKTAPIVGTSNVVLKWQADV